MLGLFKADHFQLRFGLIDHCLAHHSCQGTRGSRWSSCLSHLSHRNSGRGSADGQEVTLGHSQACLDHGVLTHLAGGWGGCLECSQGSPEPAHSSPSPSSSVSVHHATTPRGQRMCMGFTCISLLQSHKNTRWKYEFPGFSDKETKALYI